jgi:hypothetical protein
VNRPPRPVTSTESQQPGQPWSLPDLIKEYIERGLEPTNQ